ncbi:MAG: EamA family transporter, partial [Cytophagaceae bacterium]|nr:EamA family transporter [Gemmatimonadaceae bacterium]
AYMYLYTAVVAVLWGGWTWRHTAVEERRATWQAHRGAIVAIGALNMGSYFLTLLALRTDASSLVIGLRQLSIVFGVLLGAWLLGERLSRPRVLGVGLIAAGCLLIAFA